MDLTPPPLTSSPGSPPNTACSSEGTHSPSFPSPVLLEAFGIGTPPLGSDDHCGLERLFNGEDPCLRIHTMDAQQWVTEPALQPGVSSAVSSISSAEFDPFSNYDTSLPPTFSHDVYPLPPVSGQPLGSTHAAVGEGLGRQSAVRSSPTFSSGTPLLSADLGRRWKIGSNPSYGTSADTLPYDSRRPAQSPFVSEPPAYRSSPPAYLSGVHGSWPVPVRNEYPPPSPGHFYPVQPSADGPIHAQEARLRLDGTHQQQQQQPALQLPLPQRPREVVTPPEGLDPRGLRSSQQAPRRRQPRRLTTKEEANFQCEVKGCGKLFSRSYNYKAHMETHDENREYPFPCGINDCTKRFVRKTDLQRHHQSVHMKEKNHRCDYCNRLFARKDTLRRHMDDGCSKRFEIRSLDIPNEAGFEGNGVARGSVPTPTVVTSAPGILPPLATPSNAPIGMPGADLVTRTTRPTLDWSR